MGFTDSLWGGELKDLIFNPISHECVMRMEVLDGGVSSTHELRCIGVKDLRFFNEISGPWKYAEITEIEAAFEPTNSSWRIEVVLWSEQAGLVIKCREIILDEKLQTG